MDQLLINEKLESLRRCITRIEGKLPPTQQALIEDVDAQDIVILNLTRAVQLCVDIGTHIISQSNLAASQNMGDVFDKLNQLQVISDDICIHLKKAVGFRNIAVHSYRAIDWAVVYAISQTSLVNFCQFAHAISDYASHHAD